MKLKVPKKAKKILRIFFISLLFVIISAGFFYFLNTRTVKADWWNGDWFFRKNILVTNNTTEENNVYITFTLDTSDQEKFQTDCGDIRFVTTNGTILEYYIVSGCGATSTIIHTNFEVFPAGAQTISFYYGNPTVDNGFKTSDFATPASNYTIGTIYPEEKGPAPVLYFSLDEGLGTIAHDESSNHNDGTIIGAIWKDESMCKSGKCLEFDGTGDYVEVADNHSLDLSNEFTLEAWVKPQSTNLANQTIISKEETPSEPTKIYRSVGPSATTAITTGTTNAMTIVGDRATFQSALPDNVGVGDAIQYDDDNDNDIDASDSIVFINERLSGFEYRVATASGTVPVAVQGDNNWSLFRAFTSLANAEAGIENTGIDSDLRNFDDWTTGGDATTDDVGKDLVTANQQWNIACYANGTTADTFRTYVVGWTTNANSFIKIFTPVSGNEVGLSQRHKGKWDINKYRIEVTNDYCIAINSYARVEGLQIRVISAGNSMLGIFADLNSVIDSNIIRGSLGADSQWNQGIVAADGVIIKNNIIYDFIASNTGQNNGIYANGYPQSYVFNNTIVNVDRAFNNNTGGGGTDTMVLVNNIAQNCDEGNCYVGAQFDSSSSNNISNGVAGDAPGINSKNATTVSFISTTTANEDFHLSPTDTAAKDSGADLSSDNVFPFATDIDGQSRDAINRVSTAGAWDIGADEAQATKIFRSVAPNKTDALETGEENSLTIVGNTATFQGALADNVGVGDVIQYDDDNDGDIDASDSLAFIVERISSFEYIVTTASGEVPTTVIDDNDWSLFRAYTSLANAVNGEENAGINSDLRNFDTWVNGKDLITSKEQWNIVCYANGAEADNQYVNINDWNTGVLNFINISTSANDRAQLSNWDENKYILNNRIDTTENFIRIDGLQVEIVTNGEGFLVSGDSGDSDIRIINCRIRGSAWGGGDLVGIYIDDTDPIKVFIANNIIEDIIPTAGSGRGIQINNSPEVKIYNNILYNISETGMVQYIGTPIIDVKNTVVYNTGDDFNENVYFNIDHCASDDGTGTNAVTPADWNNVFMDYANGDFRLKPTGTDLRNAGVDLSTTTYALFDMEGDERNASSSAWDIGPDESTATKIFRSVGPGNTTALATDDNHENTVSVTAGVALFESDLPDRIGVGDAVLVDTNSDNAITSADTLLFIHGRNSSVSYDLRTHTGAMPADIGSNDTYQIYRAYTSLYNAEAGIENTAIAVTTFNGGNRDLVINNEEWNIACYGDSVDSSGLTINGWTTGVENFINIYTPTDASEVGISQRHNGVWDTGKYAIDSQDDLTMSLHEQYVRLNGLQMRCNNISQNGSSVISNGSAVFLDTFNDIQISNSIIRGSNNPTYWQWVVSIDDSDLNLKMWNNIIYDVNNNASVAVRITSNKTYIYNTTISGGDYGLRNVSGTTYAKNVLATNAGSYDFFETAGTLYCNNCASEDATADDQNGDGVSGNNKINQTFSFRDITNNDFRLAMTDTSVKGAGLNLTYDPNQPVTSDIEGEQRPGLEYGGGNAPRRVPTMFDIGADQISGITHNNYSFSLKTNNPVANFSTSQSDNERFSSGDTTLEANTWFHIVYKRSSSGEDLYVNGFKKDSATISDFVISNNGKLYLGAKDLNSKDSFKGLLDEIRIYNYARTENEIKKDTTQGSAGIAASRASEGVAVAMGAKSSTISDGLVGYWKMDESSWNGTAQEVKDASGNGNHGTAFGGASTTVGKFGSGGGFDGTDDYVETGTINASNGFTFSAWARPTNSTVWSQLGIFGKSQLSLDYREAGAVDYVGIRVGSAEYQMIGMTKGECLNTWCLISITYSSDGNVKIYQNGEEIGSLAADSNIAISSVFNIGQTASGNGEFFQGNIDEARIYNRSLSPDEVKQLYNYAPGPVLHLKLDEKGGTTAFDSSGNNNGTLVNEPIWGAGKKNGALSFNGSNYVSQGDYDIYGGEITVAGWVKLNTLTPPQSMSQALASKGNFGLEINDTGHLTCTFETTDKAYGWCSSVSNSVLTPNVWHYISITKDNTGYTYYLDGIKDGGGTDYSGAIINNDMDLAIGSRFGTIRRLSGLIDDVKIYNYARTQEQILEDMRGSSGVTLGGGVGALGAPILDMSFDEGFGTTVHDASGFGNDGVLTPGGSGTITTATQMWNSNGKTGKALVGDGDDVVIIPDDPSLYPQNGSWSISVWAKPENTNQISVFAEKFQVGYPHEQWIFGIAGNANYTVPGKKITGSMVEVLDTTDRDSISTDDVVDGNWHQFTMVADKNKDMILIYVDSEEVSSTKTKHGIWPTVNNTDTLYVAGVTGITDTTKIYNYALSEDEIKTLYNDSAAMVMGGDVSRNNNGITVTGANKDYCIPGDTAKCDRPILELMMNEKSGSTAYDTSGNGLNGSINGAIWGRGKTSGGIIFDGVNDFIGLNNLSLNNTNAVSVSFWFNTSVLTNDNMMLFEYSENANGNNSFYINMNEGGVDGCIGIGDHATEWNVVYTNNSYADGEWHYFEGVINRNLGVAQTKIFVDGKDDTVQNMTFYNDLVGNFGGPYSAYVISRGGASEFLNGAIDEVRVYGYARTPAQIAWDYNRGKPVLEWSFNEGSGVTTHNEIENINHGTISGATWKNESECKYGKCLSFNGVNNYVGFSSTGADNYPISFSAWVKPNTLAQNGIVLSFDGTNVNQSFGIYNDTDKLLISNDGYGINGIGNYLTAQKWQLWTLVFENVSTYRFYLDGVEISLVNVADWYNVNGNNIGARANGTQRQFNGSIDEVKIFNYALTEEQIKIDYNGGAVNFR